MTYSRFVDWLIIHNSIMSVFGERLKELIEEVGLTPAQISRQSTISDTQLSDWLRYNKVPLPNTLVKVAKFFDCSVDFLLGQKDEVDIKFRAVFVPFAERLTALIAKSQKTQYRICKELHFNSPMMTGWLKKGKLPNYENLVMLADYFDVSCDYLLGISDNR